MHFAIEIEYQGSNYHGWQRQTNDASVQAAVETALSIVADHPIQIQCAGRTDARVHATSQIASFTSTAQRKPYAWIMGTNTNLPKDISILALKSVPEAFNARFSRYRQTLLLLHLQRPGSPGYFSAGSHLGAT